MTLLRSTWAAALVLGVALLSVAPLAMGAGVPARAALDGYALRATDLIGKQVNNGRGEKLGTIDDLIITTDSRVPHAILSVGGFLGINGRLVAVPFADLTPVGPSLYLLNVSKEELLSYPAFVWPSKGQTSNDPRDQYAAEVKLRMKEWEAKVADLAAQAKGKADADATAAATRVNNAWENVKRQWSTLRDATAEKWDTTKRGFELAWQDFQREWERTGN
jgi:sporulation protein YlmC with PRC-barrel domain